MSHTLFLIHIYPTLIIFSFFFFNDTATTEIYTLSLHDALPIFDPDTIGAKPREPMYAFPGGEMHVKQGAVGIDYVMVNGEVLLDHGEHTGALPGQTLRGPLYRGKR